MKGLMLGRSIIAAACLGFLPAAFAGTPVWTFEPLTETSFSLTSTEAATVQYTVYNQSEKGKQLVLDSELTPGVQQANSCIMQPKSQKGSCLLTLNINGSALPASGLHAGPVLCEANPDGSPNHNQCYQPSVQPIDYRLNIKKTNVSQLVPISITAGSPLRLRTRGPVGSMTITNLSTTMTAMNVDALFIGTPLENNVTATSCTSIAPSSSCTITLTPGANPVATSTFAIQGTNTTAVNALLSIRASFLYVASAGDSRIYRCTIDEDASLSDCIDSGAGPSFPAAQGIAIDNNGTFAYVTVSNNVITRCTITSAGLFDAGSCINTAGNPQAFDTPIGIALTSDGRATYVANRGPIGGPAFASHCLIDETGAVGACNDAGTVTGSSLPNGIALTTNDTRVYITAPFAPTPNEEIVLCTPNAAGMLINCQNASINATYNGAHGIAFDRSGTIGYITNTAGFISRCTVNSSGLLENCDQLGAITFTNPTGIAITVEGDQAYVSDFTNNTISNCSVIGGSPTCTSSIAVGNGLQYLALK